MADTCRTVKRKCELCEVRLIVAKDYGGIMIMQCPNCQREYWYVRTCKPIWKLWRGDD